MSLSPQTVDQSSQSGLGNSLGLQSSKIYPGLDAQIPHSSFAAYPGHLESAQMISPQLHNQPFPSFQNHGGASVTNLSDGQSPMSAHPSHRMSFGSSAQLMHQLNPGSVDGSDPTSPGSYIGGGPGGAIGDVVGSMPSANNSNNTVNSQGQDEKGQDKDKDGAMPAWAELKTKAGKERKRLPLACIACRRKKIRCSGEKPACKHCLRSRIPCVYKVTTRKAAPRTDYMAMLDKRLKRMEERVIKIMPKDEQRNVDVIGRAVVKPAIPGLPAKADNKKRVADEAFGNDLDEWSKSRGSSKGKTSNKSKSQDQTKDGLLLEGAEHLPTPEIQQHLAEVYFDYVYGQSYHLLHKPSYMRKLEAGQLPPVLVLAVCAISARFSSHPEVRGEPAFLRGEEWAKPAREIALKRYDTPNITILIAYLLLGLHEFGTCQGGRSWMLGGMAQRMAYALQLHKDLDHEPQSKASDDKNELTFTDREIRRRTMWACFMMDRFNSSGTERPMFVAESFIQAQLPIKEHYFLMEITGPTENLEGKVLRSVEPDAGQITDPKQNMGCSAYFVRLVAIWGQVVRYLNLGGKERDKYPMWSSESGYAALKKTVEDYKSALPPSLQWNQENLENHASEKIANQFILLHIVNNQILLFLNRFALPIPGARQPYCRDMPQDFLGECARAAYDAASQISILVNEAMDHRVVAPFAGYSAFFSSTVHIHGLSSKNPAIEASSKQFLAWNVKFLTKMKKHWGMFYFVTEHLKDLYRQHADASLRFQRGTSTPNGQKPQDAIFQYGDWFDRYPHGVNGTDYEEAAPEVKNEPGSDAVLGQKSDLQSVEEFFAKMSPPSRTGQSRKAPRKKQAKSSDHVNTTSASATARPSSQTPVQQRQQQQHSSSSQPPPHSRHPQQPHIQIPHVDGHIMPSNPQMGFDHSPMSATPGSQQSFPHNLGHDMSLLHAQQRQQQQASLSPAHNTHMPGIMSHLDRQMVLSSYAGIDPSSHSAHFNSAQSPYGDMSDMHNAFYASNPNSSTSAPQGHGPHDAHDSWHDQSAAWFMPFNVDPPSGMGDDSGLFSGSYDFGGLTGMAGFGDLGGVNMDDLNGPGAPSQGPGEQR